MSSPRGNEMSPMLRGVLVALPCLSIGLLGIATMFDGWALIICLLVALGYAVAWLVLMSRSAPRFLAKAYRPIAVGIVRVVRAGWRGSVRHVRGILDEAKQRESER